MAGSILRRTGIVKVAGHQIGAPSPVEQWGAIYDAFNVEFDRDEFTKVIAAHGYSVLWESAALCPNRPRGALDPRDHDIACTVCNGTGFVYFSATPTKMLITGASLSQNFFAYGRFDAGRVMVTALPEERLHYFDRLTLQNGRARFHEVLLRQQVGDIDRPKYTPLAIEYLAWVNRNKQLTVLPNTAVTVTGDGYLQWNSATRPDTGSFYTIAYQYRPRYVVLDLVHQHRESIVQSAHVEFPTQAVAKLDYMVRDEGKDPDAVETVVESPFPAG